MYICVRTRLCILSIYIEIPFPRKDFVVNFKGNFRVGGGGADFEIPEILRNIFFGDYRISDASKYFEI